MPKMKSKGEKFGIVLFMLPALILFGLFFLYPVISVILVSFTKWDVISAPIFTGFRNYRLLFEDPVFIRSVKNNGIWAFLAACVQVPLAAIVALILATKPRGWKTLRVIYFLPQIISGIAIAMLWSSIYNSEYGILNKILQLIGKGDLARNWLGGLHTAFPAILIYWILYMGYHMVIMLADIINIPASYYEAANIDGATAIQSAWYITIPSITPVSLCTCMTLAMVYGLRQFEQVFVLTGGGPANRTSVVVIYLYQQMKNNAYGLSSAAGVVLIGIGTVAILIIRKLLMANTLETA
jgi:raffinose/stachyose/melibiose transport system permease protein